MKAYRLRLLTGWTGHTDGTGTRRRIRALVANDWPLQPLAERLGVSKCALSQMANGQHRVRSATADRVRALYDELADIKGPSSSAGIRGRNRGWLPPLWWDDDTMDDPDYTPPLVDGTRSRDDVDSVVVDRLVDGSYDGQPTPAERFQAFLRLRASDMSGSRIAEQLGLSGRTYSDYLHRADAAGITGQVAA